MNTVYCRFKPEDLTLRDELAIDRTLLANERTLLAYLRSGVTLFLAGITFVHFARSQWFQIIGIACVPLGFLVMGCGIYRYRLVKAKIIASRIKSEPNEVE